MSYNRGSRKLTELTVLYNSGRVLSEEEYNRTAFYLSYNDYLKRYIEFNLEDFYETELLDFYGIAKNKELRTIESEKDIENADLRDLVVGEDLSINHRYNFIKCTQGIEQLVNYYSPLKTLCVVSPFTSTFSLDELRTALSPYELKFSLPDFRNEMSRRLYMIFSNELTEDEKARTEIVIKEVITEAKGALEVRFSDLRLKEYFTTEVEHGWDDQANAHLENYGFDPIPGCGSGVLMRFVFNTCMRCAATYRTVYEAIDCVCSMYENYVTENKKTLQTVCATRSLKTTRNTEKAIRQYFQRKDVDCFICKACDKRFTEEKFVRRHIETKHEEVLKQIVGDANRYDVFLKYVEGYLLEYISGLYNPPSAQIDSLLKDRMEKVKTGNISGVDYAEIANRLDVSYY